jgi:hypothetical protein
MDIPCTAILLVMERDTHCTFKLLAAEMDTPCTAITAGCGKGLDPDSIGSVDPDSESGSRSRRAKMTHKSRKFV